MPSAVGRDRELKETVGRLVALARAGSDPVEVDYTLLRVQLILQTELNSAQLAVSALAGGPEALGSERFEDVRSIAVEKLEAITAVVNELPRLATVPPAEIDLRASSAQVRASVAAGIDQRA
jgi:hypothetical protein